MSIWVTYIWITACNSTALQNILFLSIFQFLIYHNCPWFSLFLFLYFLSYESPNCIFWSILFPPIRITTPILQIQNDKILGTRLTKKTPFERDQRRRKGKRMSKKAQICYKWSWCKKFKISKMLSFFYLDQNNFNL